MTKRAVSAMMVAAILTAGLTGCAKNYNLECDAGDYVAHDSDCGYVDNNGQWHYFSWTRPNETTYSPDGWEPPAGVEIEEDEPKIKTRKH